MTTTGDTCRASQCTKKVGKLRNTKGEPVCPAHWEAEFTSTDQSVRRLRERYRDSKD